MWRKNSRETLQNVYMHTPSIQVIWIAAEKSVSSEPAIPMPKLRFQIKTNP